MKKKTGVFKWIGGYERFDGGRPPGSDPLPAVPGVGPVTNVQIQAGILYAFRTDDDDSIKGYRLTESGWEEIAQP
jgi:hypothetical protein